MTKKRLEVSHDVVDARTVVYHLSGILQGSHQGYAFQDEVRRGIGEGANRVVIDLSAVERIDSSGVGILVTVMWSASRSGGGLVLASLTRHVEKVLGIAMLLEHIDHADTVEEALARLDAMDGAVS